MRALLFGCSIVALVLMSAACKKKPPKPGEVCANEAQHICLDDKMLVRCTSGTWVLERCTSCIQKSSSGFGSKSTTESFVGCGLAGDGPEGSPCPKGLVDCVDSKMEVVCKDGAYRHYSCKGSDGCTRKGLDITCDHDVADPGEACPGDKAIACAPDKKQFLLCRGDHYVRTAECVGPKGCREDGDILTCDEPVMEVGAPCSEGTGGCSKDRTSMVACVHGSIKPFAPCRGRDPRCVARGNGQVGCASVGISRLGDACEGSGHACSEDGRAELVCRNGVFQMETQCKRCVVGEPKPGDLTCHKK